MQVQHYFYTKLEPITQSWTRNARVQIQNLEAVKFWSPFPVLNLQGEDCLPPCQTGTPLVPTFCSTQ